MTAQTRQKTERAEISERLIRDMLCTKRKEEGRRLQFITRPQPCHHWEVFLFGL